MICCCLRWEGEEAQDTPDAWRDGSNSPRATHPPPPPLRRYNLDVDVKSVVADGALAPSTKRATKKSVKAAFEERYNTGKNKWFFSKLRF